ncbi:Hypothetical predicted protein [Olea europaea subsp. europaea]|uniref:Uncharacterized protein n=1 Tax=Olea europaea subsp. europaea TaxID=158383 RepID=A0A8S0TFQ1_OLEEU|nr:Hypothetical predicted protein [Olea europaea subsp. europaea]
MSGTRLGRGSDVAWFLGISKQFLGQVCRPRLGCVLATVGTQPDFKAFVGSLWARCAGHVQDGLGRSLIFRHFWDSVSKAETEFDFQAIIGTFRQFLEHDVQAMSGMRLVRDRDAAWFSGSFRDTVCRPFQDAVGTNPDFHIFLCSFLDTMCRQCSRLVWAVALFPGNVRDTSRPHQEHKKIFNQMKEVRCTGHARHPGTIPGILGSFWDTMCRLNSRQVRATTRMQPDFQAFLGFWAWCAVMSGTHPGTTRTVLGFQVILGVFGHVAQAMFEIRPDHDRNELDFHAFLGNFWDMMCRQYP